jgi:desulfoferrodoxin (superoxide reductase-like protein)
VNTRQLTCAIAAGAPPSSAAMPRRAALLLALALPAARAEPDSRIHRKRRDVILAEVDAKTVPYKPYPKDLFGGTYEHLPYLTVNMGHSRDLTLKVLGPGPHAINNSPHSHKDDHYIKTIWAEDQNGRILYLHDFDHEHMQKHHSQRPYEHREPVMHFHLPEKTSLIQAYALCTKHGLFQGEPMKVTWRTQHLEDGESPPFPVMSHAGGKHPNKNEL